MSVESGVGVACGCLPGCKPLMNRMFPRVFNSSTQNSWPHPSAHDRIRELQVASSSQKSDVVERNAYPLKSLGEDETGFVVPAQWQQNNALRPTALQPSLSRQGMKPHSMTSTSESVKGLRELDSMSDASSDFIVLQQGSPRWPK